MLHPAVICRDTGIGLLTSIVPCDSQDTFDQVIYEAYKEGDLLWAVLLEKDTGRVLDGRFYGEEEI